MLMWVLTNLDDTHSGPGDSRDTSDCGGQYAGAVVSTGSSSSNTLWFLELPCVGSGHAPFPKACR